VPIENLPSVAAQIAAAEAELGADGRVLVRYSGTEAKLRVMLEGDDEARLGELAGRICEAVLAEIGVEAR